MCAIIYHAGRRIQGLSTEGLSTATDTTLFSTSTGWTGDTSIFTNSGDTMVWDTSTRGTAVVKSITTLSASGTWVLRFKVTRVSGDAGDGSFLTLGSSSASTSTLSRMQNGNGLYPYGIHVAYFANANNIYIGGSHDGSFAWDFQSNTNVSWSAGDTRWVEISHASSTAYTTKVYSNANFTGTPVATSVASPSSQTLDYDEFAIGTKWGTGRKNMIIEDMQIYNGVTSVVSTTQRPTNVQVGSRWEETDTRKIYHYEDGATVSDDLTTDKGWVSNTAYWTYNATGDYIDFATITRSTTAQRIYIDMQDSDYLGSGNNLDGSSWVARFKVRTGTQSSTQGGIPFYLGFSNNLDDSGSTQQTVTMHINPNGQANENNMSLAVSRNNFETTSPPAKVNSTVYANTYLPYSTDVYMEMTRNGDVFTLKAYSDEYVTQATSTTIASVTITGISSLRYIKAFNDSEQAQSYTSGGARLYNMKIYNGVTSAGDAWKEEGT